MFTNEDLAQISAHGLTPESVEVQVDKFKSGFPYLNIARAAICGDGIVKIDDAQIERFTEYYNQRLNSLEVVKFVPASGAATRMFKELFEYVTEDKQGNGIATLLDNIEKFAFWAELKEIIKDCNDPKSVVSSIILDGLGYGSKPKALVTFHSYDSECRKAVEEHLVEGAVYAACDGVVKIHFTVSPEHIEGFESVIKERKAIYEERFNVKYDISLSTQKSKTDTVAVNPDNTLFRGDDGKLLFRPAGHGALIENIGEIDADIIFVKTIDNVTIDSLRTDTVTYKKALAGMLLELQAKSFGLIAAIDNNNADIKDVAEFVESQLQIKLPTEYTLTTLRALLDRPIRVCGMVRNEGEPGGGPFWVIGEDNSQSLQIAESSQISPEHISLMSEATHFNPVDLVCGVRNYKGEKFSLADYVDPSTGFISEKSSGGRALRAQELPGLWNGAMAYWNTIFVEVPISTFSPVKVVQDLLRAQHLAQ